MVDIFSIINYSGPYAVRPPYDGTMGMWSYYRSHNKASEACEITLTKIYDHIIKVVLKWRVVKWREHCEQQKLPIILWCAPCHCTHLLCTCVKLILQHLHVFQGWAEHGPQSNAGRTTWTNWHLVEFLQRFTCNHLSDISKWQLLNGWLDCVHIR